MKKITISTRSMYEDLLYQWELFCPFEPFPAHSVRYFLDRIISTAKEMYQDRLTEISRVKRNEVLDSTTEIVAIQNSLYFLMDCVEDTLHMCQVYFFPLYQQKKIQYLLYRVEKKVLGSRGIVFSVHRRRI